MQIAVQSNSIWVIDDMNITTKRVFRVALILATVWMAGGGSVGFGQDSGSRDRARFESGVETAAKPWTHLNFLNDPEQFQFAIVSDRTGSPRAGVFEDAVRKLNWMRPEFVMSVGDLIQGTSANGDTNAAEWDEFIGWVDKLEMPFFFLAGNHDIQAKWVEGRVPYEVMREQWEERFGTTYYYYKYKDVLFVALFSNDGIERHISPEQVDYFRGILAENADARWTMVFLHHPLWASPHDSNFHEIEDLLQDREYTVFAGHQHMYRHFERKDRNYYVLATTGGGSPLRGNEFGEFDHITWVTMTEEGPVLANIRLDGILPNDVAGDDVAYYSYLLTMSAEMESNVLLDERKGKVEGGLAYVTFWNRTPYSIAYRGSFAHNHYAYPVPGNIEVSLKPGSSKTVAVAIESMASFASHDRVFLEFDGWVSFEEEGLPDLEISGTQTIELRNRKIELAVPESMEFYDSMEFAFAFSPDVGDIRYTLDGAEPNRRSTLYSAPISIDRDATLKARLFSPNGVSSELDVVSFKEVQPSQGLICEYYEYGDNRSLRYALPDFSLVAPTTSRAVEEIDPETASRRDESFGLVYKGSIDLPESGSYLFHLESDDGARLLIGGTTVVDDPRKHPVREVSGEIRLEKGRHSFELQYFQHKQKMRLGLEYTLPSGKRRPVPSESYSFGL